MGAPNSPLLVLHGISNVIVEHVTVPMTHKLALGTEFSTDLKLDWPDVIAICAEIRKNFSYELSPDTSIESIVTVGDLIAHLRPVRMTDG